MQDGDIWECVAFTLTMLACSLRFTLDACKVSFELGSMDIIQPVNSHIIPPNPTLIMICAGTFKTYLNRSHTFVNTDSLQSSSWLMYVVKECYFQPSHKSHPLKASQVASVGKTRAVHLTLAQ